MKNKPFEGNVKLGVWSGVRKLARAIRREKLSPEHANLIKQTQHAALKRAHVHINASARIK